MAALWTGIGPNIARNVAVSTSALASYDQVGLEGVTRGLSLCTMYAVMLGVRQAHASELHAEHTWLYGVLPQRHTVACAGACSLSITSSRHPLPYPTWPDQGDAHKNGCAPLHSSGGAAQRVAAAA